MLISDAAMVMPTAPTSAVDDTGMTVAVVVVAATVAEDMMATGFVVTKAEGALRTEADEEPQLLLLFELLLVPTVIGEVTEATLVVGED